MTIRHTNGAQSQCQRKIKCYRKRYGTLLNNNKYLDKTVRYTNGA